MLVICAGIGVFCALSTELFGFGKGLYTRCR